MLELRRVNASYGESHIVSDVSLRVEPGEVVCLMGRNGVGKTTTLKTIMGLMPAQSGEIRFEGANLTKAPPDRHVRAGLGFVPQGREILPHLTVRENLRLGFWARSRTAPPISKEASFKEVYGLFPKLYHILYRPGGS
jgi:urea transport system ATP-binding protein